MPETHPERSGQHRDFPPMDVAMLAVPSRSTPTRTSVPDGPATLVEAQHPATPARR